MERVEGGHGAPGLPIALLTSPLLLCTVVLGTESGRSFPIPSSLFSGSPAYCRTRLSVPERQSQQCTLMVLAPCTHPTAVARDFLFPCTHMPPKKVLCLLSALPHSHLGIVISVSLSFPSPYIDQLSATVSNTLSSINSKGSMMV